MPVVHSKLTTRKVQDIRPVSNIRTVSLREFYDQRNKILIDRRCGGLGDILMHRMIFEDFKKIMPDAEIHFSCPKYYHDAVIDHPFIDKLIDCEELHKRNFKNEYIISYDTTTSCGRTEMKLAPGSGVHRSDIWANHCGVTLTNHNMHFNISPEEMQIGLRLIESQRDREGKSILISPISAQQNKNLSDVQILDLVNQLRDKGYYPFLLHHEPICISQQEIPTIVERKIRSWMGVVNQADYVISVDTATFHCAGGMSKPLVGIFTYTNGATYSKYYKSVEIVQGLCPVGHLGCYNWAICPCVKKSKMLPCQENIFGKNIISAFDNLTKNENNNLLSKTVDIECQYNSTKE